MQSLRLPNVVSTITEENAKKLCVSLSLFSNTSTFPFLWNVKLLRITSESNKSSQNKLKDELGRKGEHRKESGKKVKVAWRKNERMNKYKNLGIFNTHFVRTTWGPYVFIRWSVRPSLCHAITCEPSNRIPWKVALNYLILDYSLFFRKLGMFSNLSR